MSIEHVATQARHELGQREAGTPLIRLATLNDLSAIDDLANDILEEHGLARDSAVRLKDAKYFEEGERAQPFPARFWVAQFDTRIVGSIAIVADGLEACLLKTFYVARDHRGRGLGRKLYDLAEVFAGYAGFSVIRLYSSRRFDLTAAFYLRNGFRLDKSTNNAWEDDLYSKRLRGQAPAVDSAVRA